MAQYEYTLGAAGERTAVKELDRTVEYTYDALYRLTSEKITAADETVTEYTYAYDNVSNRILKTENGVKTIYTYNALNQLVKENNAVYKYDDAGNLISTTLADKSATYTYNAENKLIRATVQEGNNVSVEEYEYDYAGNRIVKKSENDYTYYLNDISGSLTQVLAELDADGNEKCWYTRGIEIISQERNGDVSYYLTDGHCSVRQLSDSTCAITDTYVYDAWGNLISSTGNTENSYLYCGEQLDSTTGLYYLRARYMNPTTGTFISMDTYQGTIFDPTSLHKYLYANANPVMNVDPSGYTTTAEIAATSSIRLTLNKTIALMDSFALGFWQVFQAKFFCSIAKSITKDLLNVVVGLLTVDTITKTTLIIKEVIIEDALSGINRGISKLSNIYTASTWMVGMIVAAAVDVITFGKTHKYPTAIHHIVEKNFWLAQPARDVLDSVGINLCANYSTAQLVLAEEAGEPNLIKIKAITHQAIHAQLCNTIYTNWVNIMMVASQSSARPKVVNYLSAVSSLSLIEGTIKAAEALIP